MESKKTNPRPQAVSKAPFTLTSTARYTGVHVPSESGFLRLRTALFASIGLSAKPNTPNPELVCTSGLRVVKPCFEARRSFVNVGDPVTFWVLDSTYSNPGT